MGVQDFRGHVPQDGTSHEEGEAAAEGGGEGHHQGGNEEREGAREEGAARREKPTEGGREGGKVSCAWYASYKKPDGTRTGYH